MKKTNILLSVLFTSHIAFSGSLVADEMVKGHIMTSDNSVVTSGSGECARTENAASELRAECGEVVQVEVVDTATAGSISARLMNAVVIGGGMLFDFDSAELSDDAKAVIDERIERVKGRVKLSSDMVVEGHTDSVGSEAYNMDLSKRRAQAVADYIATKSYRVKAGDIQVIGKGEAEPVASNATREGREVNRRVVILAEGVVDK